MQMEIYQHILYTRLVSVMDLYLYTFYELQYNNVTQFFAFAMFSAKIL